MKNANLVLRLIAAVTLCGLTACGAGNKDAEATPIRKTVADFFPIKVGDKMVRVQLAILDAEQERGLMYRRDLGRDDGMLFVYAKPQQMNFWMRNTPTALDIGFFDPDGVLFEVYPMQPFDETTVSSRSANVKFPLEMNQGWFAQNGIRPGAKLDLKALAAAVKARGFEPRQYGLPE